MPSPIASHYQLNYKNSEQFAELIVNHHWLSEQTIQSCAMNSFNSESSLCVQRKPVLLHLLQLSLALNTFRLFFTNNKPTLFQLLLLLRWMNNTRWIILSVWKAVTWQPICWLSHIKHVQSLIQVFWHYISQICIIARLHATKGSHPMLFREVRRCYCLNASLCMPTNPGKPESEQRNFFH